MDARMFGSLWPVSALTIGGGGIGQVWGPTDRDEAVATLQAAVEGGINLIDVAPTYGDGEAEEVVGRAFQGRLPAGVRISTKCHVAHNPGDPETEVRRSLDESLARMRVDFVDVFILHSQILPEPDPERTTWTIPLHDYREAARPVFRKLVDEGRAGAWGITAAQFPDVLDEVFAEHPTPQVAQMIANVLDAPGDMQWSPGTVDHRGLIARAKQRGLGTMGIRAVQAGALTDSLDRDLAADSPARVDFERAAPFRAIAAELGETAASLAHRYALSMDGVDTVVLGVKNRTELAECLAAAEAGPLTRDVVHMIDHRLGGTRKS